MPKEDTKKRIRDILDIPRRLKYLYSSESASRDMKLHYLFLRLAFSKKKASRLLAESLMDFGPDASAQEGVPCFRIKDLVIHPPYPLHAMKDKDTYLANCGCLIVESFLFTEFIFPAFLKPRPGDVCLDVGADIGTTSILLSQMIGAQGRVYSFEPVFHQVLNKNLMLNAPHHNWKVVGKAVTDQSEETVHMQENECFPATHICHPVYKPDASARLHQVKTISLDDFARTENLQRVDYIKMDIEGAEELALRGAQRILSQFKPRLTISSYHKDFQGEKQHYKLMNILKEYHYRIREYPHEHIWAF